MSTMVTWTCLGFILVSQFCFSTPKEVGGRILDTNHLGDSVHFSDGNHNPQYDHEAFLGEEAKSFDQLSPDESQQRLGDMVDKIDKDGDKYIDFDELRAWIQHAQKNYIREDVDRQWKSHNPDNVTLIKWAEYKRLTYGFMEELDTNQVKSQVDEDTKTYKEMMRRDKRRWDLADQDGDGSLSKIEFADFLHPEETSYMHPVVVDETLEDIDKNKDGKISLEEYISDMFTPQSTDEGHVPDWVIREREQFKDFRDRNGDGFLDRSEVKDWIIPPDYDHSDAEAKHLIHESDDNRDGKLSKQEILNNYDLFVGSQATDFGEALVNHDEF